MVEWLQAFTLSFLKQYNFFDGIINNSLSRLQSLASNIIWKNKIDVDNKPIELYYPRKFDLCVCVQLWEIIHVACTKSSISTLQCYTLVILDIVTCYINPLLLCIYIITTKLHKITCTLVATGMILWRVECMDWTVHISLRKRQLCYFAQSLRYSLYKDVPTHRMAWKEWH